MNQKELLERLKTDIYNFPEFLKSLIKKPLKYVDTSYPCDWILIVLYCYLVEALTQVIFSVFLLNFSGILGSLIFGPMQMLVILGFLSFVLWLVFDKLGFSRITVLDIFKSLAFIEMIVSLFVLPVLIVASYIPLFELPYLLESLIIAAKAFLLYRVLSRQFGISNQKSMGVSIGIAVLFLIPTISGFIENYEDHLSARNKAQYNEQMMEDSIKAIEEEFKKED